MDVLELLKGKKMSIMTDMKVSVELIIKEVKEDHHSRDLEPSTRENDWWPATQDWKTYTVFFTNGSNKTFSSLSEIKILD
jgi:hypothetical protein